MVPLKYLIKFWRSLDLPLINCKIEFFCHCHTTFQINSAKLYIPVVTLSINDNTKVLENLKHGFKIVVCCNK